MINVKFNHKPKSWEESPQTREDGEGWPNTHQALPVGRVVKLLRDVRHPTNLELPVTSETAFLFLFQLALAAVLAF